MATASPVKAKRPTTLTKRTMPPIAVSGPSDAGPTEEREYVDRRTPSRNQQAHKVAGTLRGPPASGTSPSEVRSNVGTICYGTRSVPAALRNLAGLAEVGNHLFRQRLGVFLARVEH